MRWPIVLLAALLALLQYPLWLGKGGWFRVWELDRQLERQVRDNAAQRERNAALAGEVRDLRQGSQAIEERARYELGMMAPGEVFVSVLRPHAGAAGSVAPEAAAPEAPR